MRKILSQFSMVVFLSVVSCNPRPVENQQEIIKEIESREIRRVTRAAIMEEALKQGDLISNISQQKLSETLASAIQTGGIPKAVEKCMVSGYPLIDSLSNAYEVEIRRVSLKPRNPIDTLDSVERDILEAYEYAQQNSLELVPNVEEISKDVILYTKPIMITNPLCLRCHGKLDLELTMENHKVIHSLYPADSAIGYSMGDLRGMWSIQFLKKNLVNVIH